MEQEIDTAPEVEEALPRADEPRTKDAEACAKAVQDALDRYQMTLAWVPGKPAHVGEDLFRIGGTIQLVPR